MLLCNPQNTDNEGFCFGEYVITVDIGPRIRFPRAILRDLKNHEVERLWKYPDPTGHRMIIVPDKFNELYIKSAEKQIQNLENTDYAFRFYIGSGEWTYLKEHGRISITRICNQILNIKSGNEVILVGAKFWYELWPSSDWMRMAEDSTKN